MLLVHRTGKPKTKSTLVCLMLYATNYLIPHDLPLTKKKNAESRKRNKQNQTKLILIHIIHIIHTIPTTLCHHGRLGEVRWFLHPFPRDAPDASRHPAGAWRCGASMDGPAVDGWGERSIPKNKSSMLETKFDSLCRSYVSSFGEFIWNLPLRKAALILDILVINGSIP